MTNTKDWLLTLLPDRDRLGHLIGAGFCDEIRCAAQRLEGAGIRPPAVQHAVRQDLFLQIEIVEIGDFEFAASGRLQCLDLLEHRAIEEINSGDCELRLRLLGLFFDAAQLALNDLRTAKAVRIFDFFQNDVRAAFLAVKDFGSFANVVLDDVVAKENANTVAFGEMFGQTQRVSDSTLAFLIGVIQALEPEIFSIREQTKEITRTGSTGDDENVLDPRVDQRLDRIKNHRLVEHRKKMFVGNSRERMKAGTNTAGQNDALHCLHLRGKRNSGKPRPPKKLAEMARL